MPVTNDRRFYLPYEDLKLVLALPAGLPDPGKLQWTLATFLPDRNQQNAAAAFISLMRPFGVWVGVAEEVLLLEAYLRKPDAARKFIAALNALGRADHIDSRSIGGTEFYLPNPRFARLAANLALPS